MTISSNPPIEIPLECYTLGQKWALYRTLQQELEPEPEIPAWHLELLQEREERIASGKAHWIPLEEVIETLRSELQ